VLITIKKFAAILVDVAGASQQPTGIKPFI
jgi:hypothetical protein